MQTNANNAIAIAIVLRMDPVGNGNVSGVNWNDNNRFVKHNLKPQAYMRYGDDFVIIEPDAERLRFFRMQTVNFLKTILKLEVNPKSDRIVKSRHGLKYLGVKIWPDGCTLTRRNLVRIKERLNFRNVSSYGGLIKQHGNYKQMKKFNWMMYERLTLDFFE